MNYVFVLSIVAFVMPLAASATKPGSENAPREEQEIALNNTGLISSASGSATAASSASSSSSSSKAQYPVFQKDAFFHDERSLFPVVKFLNLNDFTNRMGLASKSMCGTVREPNLMKYYLKHRFSGKWIQTKKEYVLKEETSHSLTEAEQKVFSMMNESLVRLAAVHQSLVSNEWSPSEWVLQVDGSSADSISGFGIYLESVVKVKLFTPKVVQFLGKNRIKIITFASFPLDGTQSLEEKYEKLIQSFEIMTPDSLENPESLPDPNSVEVLKTMLSTAGDGLSPETRSTLGLANREEVLNWYMNLFFNGILRPNLVMSLRRSKFAVMSKMVSADHGKDPQKHVHGKDEKNELAETEDEKQAEIKAEQIIGEKDFSFHLSADGNSFTLTEVPSVLEGASAEGVGLYSKLLTKTTFKRVTESKLEETKTSEEPTVSDATDHLTGGLED